MSTVVVGVDGSPGSERALRFAVEEARQRGATLRVVSAWHFPVMVNGGGGVLVAPIGQMDFEESARHVLEKSLLAMAEEIKDVAVEQVVEQGQAAQVLLKEAEGADLLVVGTRGHGGFAGLLLGSVSQQCAHHAHCPVAIVPQTVSRSEAHT